MPIKRIVAQEIIDKVSETNENKLSLSERLLNFQWPDKIHDRESENPEISAARMKQKVSEWNSYLEGKSAEEIINYFSNFPGLFQLSSFGPTGLVILDLQPKKAPILFINTLHLFPETLELVQRVEAKYKAEIHEIKVMDKQIFQQEFGTDLYKRDESKYDYLVKVLPAHVAYHHLNVKFVFTGRRRTQGGGRSSIDICEWDQGNRIVKINPLYNWTFDQVWSYLRINNVPYNSLHDKGYKSIGDVHSTEIGTGEREGRWKATEKTECGLHEDYFAKKIAAKKLAV